MNIIIDIILAAAGILTVYCAYKKGFVSTVISLIGLLLALVFASYLGFMAADYIYDDVVGDKISQNIIDDFKANSGDDINDALPKYVSNYFKNSNEKSGGIFSDGFDGKSAHSAVKMAIKTPVTALITVVAFLILFVLFLLLFRWIAKLAGIINKIPVIGKLNSLLGGLLGIAKALLIIYLLCFLFSRYIMLSQNKLITVDDLNGSVIFKFFCSKFNSLKF